jgi:uncharacterized alkaline shock family protein YloU
VSVRERAIGPRGAGAVTAPAPKRHPRASCAYNHATASNEVDVPGKPISSYSPEVIATYVWDAIKDVDGVADLHRSPLQSLGGKVKFEKLSPVRVEEGSGGPVIEVHLVVTADADIPAAAAAVTRSVTTYLRTMTGIETVAVRVFVDDVAD